MGADAGQCLKIKAGCFSTEAVCGCGVSLHFLRGRLHVLPLIRSGVRGHGQPQDPVSHTRTLQCFGCLPTREAETQRVVPSTSCCPPRKRVNARTHEKNPLSLLYLLKLFSSAACFPAHVTNGSSERSVKNVSFERWGFTVKKTKQHAVSNFCNLLPAPRRESISHRTRWPHGVWGCFLRDAVFHFH